MIGSAKNKPVVFVIFGATGDLTYRKLLPAFYDLVLQGKYDHTNLQIVAIGRRPYDTVSFFDKSWQGILDYTRFKQSENASRDEFRRMLSYVKMDFNETSDYDALRTVLKEQFDTKAHYMFYLAVAPSSFTTITNHLDSKHILEDSDCKTVMIEKPFGDDLQSAISIHEELLKTFEEKEIYRIDHYLAKEMIINIMTIRFGNAVFETLWNAGPIDNIQITASEMIGVDDRGSYYDQTGALEDMVQSHLLQVLSIILMDKPTSNDASDIHKAQADVLSKVQLFDTIENSYVRGQYVSDGEVLGYRQESRVDPVSETETYAALKLRYNHKQFKDVPIYVRTGKRVDKAGTYVAIQFKGSQMMNGHTLDPNVLIIRIGPDEGIYLKVNIKKPGLTDQVQDIKMDFCQSCILENRFNTPQAYERLLNMVINEDHTLFASWDFALRSWQLIDDIQNQAHQTDLQVYEAFTQGPTKADEMLAEEGHEWINDTVYGQIAMF